MGAKPKLSPRETVPGNGPRPECSGGSIRELATPDWLRSFIHRYRHQLCAGFESGAVQEARLRDITEPDAKVSEVSCAGAGKTAAFAHCAPASR